MKYKLLILIFCLSALFFSGCAANDVELKDALAKRESEISALNQQLDMANGEISDLQGKLADVLETSTNPLDEALEIVNLLNKKDFTALSEHVHPEKGVRFSPYGNIKVASDRVFSAGEVPGLFDDTQSYLWGYYDGSGEPIELTFSDYYEKFVYDADFSNPQIIGNNHIIGQGNTVINIADVYPEAAFVEFHFTGFDPQYTGMDWKSLRIIMEPIDGIWYLTGISHDQWTI